MSNKIGRACLLLMAALLFVSCLDDDYTDDITLYDDNAITQFNLTTAKLTVHTTTSGGEDSTYVIHTETVADYPFYIDQLKGEIYNVDSLPKGIDKARSLGRLLEILGMKREQMIACGDGYNDLSMIRFAGLGVAMENAVLPVRQEDPHYGNAGVLLSELPVFIPILEKAGVTSFHVTLGDHGSLTDTIPPASHPYFGGEGCFLPYCDEVRRYTKLPVCGVGSLRDPDFVEKALKEGRIDCAAMSRQLIADPDWPKKVSAGRTKEILRCVRCNRDCLGGIQRHEGVHCIYDKKRQEISDREVRK